MKRLLLAFAIAAVTMTSAFAQAPVTTPPTTQPLPPTQPPVVELPLKSPSIWYKMAAPFRLMDKGLLKLDTLAGRYKNLNGTAQTGIQGGILGVLSVRNFNKGTNIFGQQGL